jgi:hypothetical protein
VAHHSIRYNFTPLPAFDVLAGECWRLLYLASICCPLLVSLNRHFKLFAASLAVSAAVSHLVFWYAFESVWCFFAAALSLQLCHAFRQLPAPREGGGCTPTGLPEEARSCVPRLCHSRPGRGDSSMTNTTTTAAAVAAAEQAFGQVRERVARYAASGPEGIACRLEELDREWDVERVLAAGGAAAVVAGVALGALDRRLLTLPALVGGLLLLNAVRGWSPPAVLRRLGYRTAAEIDEERYALKSLRGDFLGLRALTPHEDRADVARFEGEGGTVTGHGATDAHDRHDQAAANEALHAARR